MKQQPILTLSNVFLFSAAVILCGFFLFGCGSGQKATPTPGPRLSTDKRMLVLPFKDMTEIHGTDGMIKCPVCDNFFTAGPVSVNATDFLTSQLIKNLESRTEYQLEVQNRLFSGFITDGKGGKRLLSEFENLIKEGQALKKNYLMTGYIYRFRERVGRGFSAETPASVAFSVHLVDIVNERVMWSGTYEETQQALSKNLFNLGTFVNRGGGWVTAEELAGAAMDKMLSGFGQK